MAILPGTSGPVSEWFKLLRIAQLCNYGILASVCLLRGIELFKSPSEGAYRAASECSCQVVLAPLVQGWPVSCTISQQHRPVAALILGPEGLGAQATAPAGAHNTAAVGAADVEMSAKQ
jgi:hypothetical protein